MHGAGRCCALLENSDHLLGSMIVLPQPIPSPSSRVRSEATAPISIPTAEPQHVHSSEPVGDRASQLVRKA